MKARSADYIALQNVYKAKARSDLAEVTSHVRTLESSLSRPTPIDGQEIEAFCKNAAFVKLVHGRLLPDIWTQTSEGPREKWMAKQLGDADSLFPVTVALAILDRAMAATRPESSSSAPRSAAALVEALDAQIGGEKSAEEMVGEFVEQLYGCLAEREKGQFNIEEVTGRLVKVFQEVRRSGPCELHNIASLAGGLVAQEVIKVVTKQYVPVDSTCVFDGVGSRSKVFRL